MKTLATIGDNCVDIYPQLNKAFSGGNAVNVAVLHSLRHKAGMHYLGGR